MSLPAPERRLVTPEAQYIATGAHSLVTHHSGLTLFDDGRPRGTQARLRRP